MIARARIAAKKTKSSAGSSSNFSQGLRKDYIEQRYIKIVRDKMDSLWYNVLFLLLVGLFMAAIILQAVIGYNKYNTFAILQRDIEHRIMSTDQASMALTSAVNLAMYIDLSKAVEDGKIKDIHFSEFDTPSILMAVHELSQSLKGKMYYYSKKVDLSMINVSYKNIVDLGYFTYDQTIVSYFIDFNQSANNDNVFWYKSAWGAKKFLQYMQPYIDSYITATKVHPLTGQLEMIRDYLSLALSESVMGYLATISDIVKSYFVGESQMSYNNILTAQLGSIMSLAAIIIVVVAYCGALQLKMNWLYKLIFNFKVIFFYEARRHGHRNTTLGKSFWLLLGVVA